VYAIKLITDCRVNTSLTDGRNTAGVVAFMEKSLSVDEDVGRSKEALDSSSV